jgi:hypothetical protein
MATFLGAIVIFASGKQGIPMEFAERFQVGEIKWLWEGLAVSAAPLWLSSVHMIARGSGKTRYRGFWVRTIADMLEGITLFTYDYMRITLGGTQIVLIYISVAATLFTLGLIYRDIHVLVATEQLAGKIRHRGSRESNDADAQSS